MLDTRCNVVAPLSAVAASGENGAASGSEVALTLLEASRLRRRIERDGKLSVCMWLGLSRSALANAVACLPVQRATAALIRSRLAEQDEPTEPGAA